jgi:ribonuclease HI
MSSRFNPLKRSFYAVARGKKPGIYSTWDECKAAVEGFSNAKYRKFNTREEAEKFVKNPVISSVKSTSDVSQTDVDHMPEDGLVVFTDGSSLANGKSNSRAGYAVVWPKYAHLTKSITVPSSQPQTNNRAEYLAAHTALKQANEIDPELKQKLYVFTDSKLLINSVTLWIKSWKRNGWKTTQGGAVEHQDLLKDIDLMCSKRTVVWHHVRAHTGGSDWKSRWNNEADELAKKAASQSA